MTRDEIFRTAMKRGKAGLELTDAQWAELQRRHARLPDERAKRKLERDVRELDQEIADVVAATPYELKRRPSATPWLLAMALAAALLHLAVLLARLAQ